MLDQFLPPIPDDAQPTGERGDLVTRLIATLIDIVPSIIISIVFMVAPEEKNSLSFKS